MERKTRPNLTPPVSIVVPAYNEEAGIAETVLGICRAMEQAGFVFEVVVVDDCSSDGTQIALEQIGHPSLKVLRHMRNMGYGAALKTGIRAALHPVVAITDADGTYPNERLPELVAELGDMDMIVGARTTQNVRIPLARRPAKWMIGKLANYLARCQIPDINSGLRVFNRKTVLGYLGILPEGFSFTTTVTLAMLTCGDKVKYVPIDYAPRIGKSKLRPIRDTLNFIQLIFRTILLFEPLRVFLPVSFLMFLASIGVFLFSWLYIGRIMDMTTTLLFVGGLQILAIGMLADMINRRLGR